MRSQRTVVGLAVVCLLLVAMVSSGFAQEGRISGTVTAAGTGLPVAGAIVTVGDGAGIRVATTTIASGEYLVGSLDSGTYFVWAKPPTGVDLIPQVYGSATCSHVSHDCLPLGTPIRVVSPDTVGNINIALRSGGSITGTVVNSSTLAPVSGVDVYAYVPSPAGLRKVNFGVTSAAGVYTVHGLPSGIYSLMASPPSSRGLLTQAYGGTAVLGAAADAAQSLPVPLTAPGAVTGIDFALPPSGGIAGNVTDATTGDPLDNCLITAYRKDDTPTYARHDFAEAGVYKITGLPSGTYYLFVDNCGSAYAPQAYPGVACQNMGSACVVTGTPVTVTVPVTTTNIDIEVSRSGTIAGTVTNAVTSAPIADAMVIVSTLDGAIISLVPTDALGKYSVPGLVAGGKLVKVTKGGFQPGTTDKPVPVTPPGTTRANFALVPGGTITGRVTAAMDGAAVEGALVFAYVASGGVAREVSRDTTDASGNYKLANLGSGTHYVWVSASNAYMVAQTYSGVSCPDGASACILSGRSVAVTAPKTTPGINIQLVREHGSSGTVTDAVTGAPVAGAMVQALKVDGAGLSLWSEDQTDHAGNYFFSLPPGAYYFKAKTSWPLAYATQVFELMACPNDTCDPRDGDSRYYSGPGMTLGIDFTLMPAGSITGTITAVLPVAGTVIDILSVSGSTATIVGSTTTSAAGRYVVSGLPVGVYRVRATPPPASGLMTRLYRYLTCPLNACDPSDADPVSVSAAGPTTGIDIELQRGASISGTVVAEAGSMPIAGTTVGAHVNDSGTLRHYGVATTAADGTYTVRGLPTGSYYVWVMPPAASGLAGEVYDNRVCETLACVMTGTAVSVVRPTAQTGISFALAPPPVAPVVTTHPSNAAVTAGATATFTAAASGTPAPTVQWQVSTNGGTSYTNLTDTAPYSGVTTGTLTVTGATVGLNGYRYRAVFTNAGGTATSNAAVLTVNVAPAVTTHPSNAAVTAGATATFTAAASGTPAPTVQWQVSTNGGTSYTNLTDTAPYSGVTTGTLTVTGATVGLNGYRYRAVFTNAGGTATSNAAVLTVYGPLSASPAALRLAATKSGAAGALVAVTPTQTVTVAASGAASAWTAASSVTWLAVTNGSGTGAGLFSVAVANPSNVIAGSTLLTGSVVVTPSRAGLSPVTIPVTLTVDQTGGAATVPPFGLVDTPAQNATGVQGTIGVTGWVLDDVGVASVKLYRGCLAFEPPTNCATVAGRAGQVFVGDATLVSGARTDIEGLYPTYPLAYRAAWGYLLLTNLLPHVPGSVMYGGQGAFSFSVLATDVEGKPRWLGRTQGDTLATQATLANDTIAKPFGALDTPGQGATVSGLAFANFGWALTPDGNTTGGEAGDILMPVTGSTLQLWIDGAPVAGAITYNQCRGTIAGPMPAGQWCNDDVANIFGNVTPQAPLTARTSNPTKFRNLDLGRGAIGALVLDTTTLSNGVHTIMWGVTDSAARGEGLGSRYFTVLNTGTRAADESAVGAGFPAGDSPEPSAAAVSQPQGAKSFVGAGFSQPRGDVRLKRNRPSIGLPLR